ncbi:MAG: 2-dehydropantoate 2-reductase [Nitrospiraceae bacterium]|nr:2-dehydropantoate 2-reductase [Nitrospiraceae bacterium]MSR23509.1 2-dehydropantoate 2-reductase [Nitrospiraceae bacterium]
MQQIMIVGAGSVGGFFGAHLAKGNPNVSFLLRPRTLQAVTERGLILRSASGILTVRPPAASDPRELVCPDLIILAVKAYDLDEVMDQLEPVLTAKTIILTLQNGVDVEDRIHARLHRDCVVGGVAFIYSKIVEPGVIEHYKGGSVAIGEMMGHKSERLGMIADLFKQAGIQCRISDDIRRSKWEKMCWNCVFNPITVLINDRVAKALDNPEMMGVIRQIVGEVAAVSATLKVPLAPDIAEKTIQATQAIRDIHTSMYDDWKAGRPTEIDSLNGYIVQKGRELGIPTPVNEALTAMVKAVMEKEKSGPGILRIEGAVVQPVTLDRESLTKLPAEHQVSDLGTIMPNMKGKAIRVKGVLEVPALAVGADHVTFHSQDGQFAASLTVKQAAEYGVLVYELDGQPMPESKGGPFRLVAPGLGDLCANVKGVVRIELTKGPGKDTRPSRKAT